MAIFVTWNHYFGWFQKFGLMISNLINHSWFYWPTNQAIFSLITTTITTSVTTIIIITIIDIYIFDDRFVGCFGYSFKYNSDDSE